METEILPTSNTQKRLATHSAQLWPENENCKVKRFKGRQFEEATRRETKNQTEIVENRFKERLQKKVSTCVALSPITELSKNLNDTNLTTPKATKKSVGCCRMKHFRDLQCEFESDNARDIDDGIDHVASGATILERKREIANELRPFNSLSSTDSNSLDDEYITIFEMESRSVEGNEPAMLNLPKDLDTLISGKLNQDTFMPTALIQNKQCEEKTIQLRRPKVRRCLSLMDYATDPQMANDSFGLNAKSPCTPLLALSRPPDDATPIRRTTQTARPLATTGGNNVLRKCMSLNDAQIMTALDRSDQIGEPQLIGDFSKPCALPLLTTGQRHRDLKTITSGTLARLMAGEFGDVVKSYHIVDCRFPYEYLGGHIRDASNLYTPEQINSTFPTLLKQQKRENSDKGTLDGRNIVIFHCEFSSERGPKLMRFLRNNDRETHTNVYPELDYPELYLLHNGYKEFYETQSGLCEPCGYVPMLSPAHNEQYRLFRAKSKSWQGDSGPGGTTLRIKKSRSRLALDSNE